MKKVAFIIYRDWTFQIYKKIAEYQKLNPTFEIPLLITTLEREFDIDEVVSGTHVVVCAGNDHEKIGMLLAEHAIDVVFYYGWSWMVKEPILSDKDQNNPSLKEFIEKL